MKSTSFKSSAALPPDVRKGSAFPCPPTKETRAAAPRELEAQPQSNSQIQYEKP